MHAVISIHDVMPHTLDRVGEILARMSHLAPSAITLLIVPGLGWSPAQLDTLKTFQESGYSMAGHGWFHRTRDILSLYHRLHSTLISRQAAEHLSLTETEIDTLIRDCYQWFDEHDLALPDLYVPPAWAMGNISAEALAQTPFRYFETTAGFYDSVSGRKRWLPLMGFEADTLFRAITLTFWNSVNYLLGTPKRPLRLSIHPNDHQLRLGQSLDRYLARVTKAVPYQSVL